MNWIEGKTKEGINPPIPEKFKSVLEVDPKDKPIDETMVPIVPSGQTWSNWSDKDKQEWREMVEFLKKDPDDFLILLRKMLPATPKGELWREK